MTARPVQRAPAIGSAHAPVLRLVGSSDEAFATRRDRFKCALVIGMVAVLSSLEPTPTAAQSRSQPGHWRTEVFYGDAPIVVGSVPRPVDGTRSLSLPASRPPAQSHEPQLAAAAGPPIASNPFKTESGLEVVLALMFLLPTVSLCLSVGSGVSGIRRLAQVKGGKVHRPRPPSAPIDIAATTRRLIDDASQVWQRAEVAVMNLDQTLPIRMLLQNEMDLVRRRLAAIPATRPNQAGALSQRETEAYWKLLAGRIGRSMADLQRIVAIAEASQASFGRRAEGPRMPETLEDAYFILGAHSGTDEDNIKRLVRALRQCWHPDLARDDADRTYREFRIRQINVANDILSSRNVQA